MMTAYLSPLFNHLWQSTLFAGVAASLAVALRNNRAQTRYGLWLLASLKFLVPFSLLVAVGSLFSLPAAAPIAHPAFSVAIRQIGQPFMQPAISFAAAKQSAPAAAGAIPAILFAIWLCGFMAVALSWSIRWLRIRAIARAAAPLAADAPIRVLSSPSQVEPGVFGIFRPVLLLPAGIEERLTRAHLNAVLAHELCHVRRRDNLAAAIHMLVEALFWFHPLVWWIGARMIEERECACDEEVLGLGNQPRIYAESILKTCEFCVESPLACVSGITGSDLKRRIARIMSHRIAGHLNLNKKLLLAIAGAVVTALPLAVGLAQTQQQSDPASQPSFEVASIKPSNPGGQMVMMRILPGGGFRASGITMKLLMEQAYGIKDSQLSGAPPWFGSDRYDIEAKPDEATGAALDKLTPDQRKDKMMQMMQSLLTERLNLKLGHETKELPVYALVVAKNGPKFHESTFKPPEKPGPPPPMPKPGEAPAKPMQGIRMNGRGSLTLTYVGLDMFADVLSRVAGRVVVNKTGLTGKYDFTLQWTPEEGQGPMMPGGGPGPEGAAPPPESSSPSLFTAIQEQLGLKLEPQKAPVEIFVIEHVEKPSEN